MLERLVSLWKLHTREEAGTAWQPVAQSEDFEGGLQTVAKRCRRSYLLAKQRPKRAAKRCDDDPTAPQLVDGVDGPATPNEDRLVVFAVFRVLEAHAGLTAATVPHYQRRASSVGQELEGRFIGKEVAQKMRDQGIELVMRVRKNMKEVARSDFDYALLRKRLLV